MGKKTKSPGLAGALFSQVQLRVLRLFMGQPDHSYQISDVIRLAKSGSGAIQRELEKLTMAGILAVSISGKRKTYRANRQSPIFDELHRMIMKTVGLVDPVRASLEPFCGNIELAFVYGSVANGKDTAGSDIDLMVFGRDLSYAEIYGALEKTQKFLNRTINPTITSSREWRQKLSQQKSFFSKVSQQPKLFVLGSDDELRRIEQSRQKGPDQTGSGRSTGI